jgi:hypothetical protein
MYFAMLIILPGIAANFIVLPYHRNSTLCQRGGADPGWEASIYRDGDRKRGEIGNDAACKKISQKDFSPARREIYPCKVAPE